MTDLSPAVAAVWACYLQTLPKAPTKRLYEAFHFGDSQVMADELAALVLAGTKTATSSLLWSYEDSGKPQVQTGDLSVVTTWSGEPVCVIETLEVLMRPFESIDAQFAWDYGEGDRSLSWWRTNLWAYYARACAKLGRPPAEGMPLVCERFRVVFSAAAP
jgi:uncharacterized protein YhfF